MIAGIKRKVILNLKNIPGWKTKRRIVVFESDDWGSLRIKSEAALDRLIEAGVLQKRKGAFDSLDSMESKEDMTALFEVLSSVKDFKGRNAVFTPFVNLTNPDFEAIKSSGFTTYSYKRFTETMRDLGNEEAFGEYQNGISSSIFLPEYHGREHLNVASWMEMLKKGEPKVLEGFKNEFTSVNLPESSKFLKSFRQTYFYRNPSEVPFLQKSIREGAEIFEQMFGYRTTVFDAPNAIFHPDLEETLQEVGIKNIVLQRLRMEPDGKGGANTSYYKFGQKNKWGQIYHIRNCMFEPFMSFGEDACLGMINAAFRWGKPAIVTTHRVNYMGGIDKANRDRSLKHLSTLLKTILKKWPDAEFMSSGEFARLMHNK